MLRFIVVLLIPIFFSISSLFAHGSSIFVNISDGKGVINKKVFGNNLLGHDPSIYRNRYLPDYKNTDFGAGIWDPISKKIVPEAKELALNSGVSVLRFPGGIGANYYYWKDSIGEKKKHYLFGINEFLQVSNVLGTDVVYTLNCLNEDANSAVELVEYLYSKGVRYFEIGNEVWANMDARQYAEQYLKFYNKIKIKTPFAMIGVVLLKDEWDYQVLARIKDKADFGIIHIYPSIKNVLTDTQIADVYQQILAFPTIKYVPSIQNTLKLLRETSGKNTPLAVTEYNVGLRQERPIPYRHALGTALLNAELLRIFMEPKNNILMANNWNFCNEYWGMVANGFDGTYKTLHNPYYKRPNYYVFAMYAKHFGDILIDVDVKCDTYDASEYQLVKSLTKRLKTGTLIKKNLLRGSWEIKATTGVNAIEKDGVLKIEFVDCFVAKKADCNDTCTYNYYHSVKKANVESKADYKLSGYIKTDSLIDDKGVCLEVQDGRGWIQTKSVATTEKIKGTTDWQYVEVIYETLPDAKAVNVRARRVGETGPLKGKAYFKDVKLEKFIPSLDTKIPYLSVNASKSADGKNVYLMVINKNMDAPMTATIDLKDFVPAAKGNAWVLNGPSVDATNELKHDNVKVTHREFEIASAAARLRNDTAGAALRSDASTKFEYTFEPHSLTAIEIASADKAVLQ